MTDPDRRLRRLLDSAASATPRELPPGAPLGFATRVLANLRPEATPEENAAFTGMLFRRALVCGFAIMLLAVAASYSTIPAPESTEMQVANSAVEMSLP